MPTPEPGNDNFKVNTTSNPEKTSTEESASSSNSTPPNDTKTTKKVSASSCFPYKWSFSYTDPRPACFAFQWSSAPNKDKKQLEPNKDEKELEQNIEATSRLVTFYV